MDGAVLAALIMSGLVFVVHLGNIIINITNAVLHRGDRTRGQGAVDGATKKDIEFIKEHTQAIRTTLDAITATMNTHSGRLVQAEADIKTLSRDVAKGLSVQGEHAERITRVEEGLKATNQRIDGKGGCP